MGGMHGRVVVLPRVKASEMTALLSVADVVLDTWPFGARLMAPC